MEQSAAIHSGVANGPGQRVTWTYYVRAYKSETIINNTYPTRTRSLMNFLRTSSLTALKKQKTTAYGVTVVIYAPYILYRTRARGGGQTGNRRGDCVTDGSEFRQLPVDQIRFR